MDRIENEDEGVVLEDDEGVVIEEEIEEPEVKPEVLPEPEVRVDRNALTDEEQGTVLEENNGNQDTFQVETGNLEENTGSRTGSEPEIEADSVQELTVDVLNDIEPIAEKDLLDVTQDAIIERCDFVIKS